MKLQRGKRNIFILIDIELDANEDELMESLLEFEEVKEAHIISGQYDILAVAEIDLHGKTIFSTVQELSRDLVGKVRRISGIRDTNTIVPYATVTR
ncbi:MAG: Lrp/AsnC ligand binding domain-containing protein [Candidatus Bathyarchaeota archaeon]|nr:MAG: Lrp/AsnC ligand binding domain-containing protein [Candidatus Bathyarchaeota archaeon]